MDGPKIGLALGSGGARGFAHLGVLKALSENNIPVHLLAGSSMGALVGCLYAFGHDISRLIQLSTAFRKKYYLDFTVPKMGFIAGNRVKGLVHLFTHGKHLEELPIPAAVIATDLQTGEKIEFHTGLIADAVRASIAIPGIFTPEKIGGRLMVDGGVAERVPISTVKKMGADIVIGVEVGMVNRTAEIANVFDVIMQSIDILQMELMKTKELEADIMIRPRVESYNGRAFTDIEEIIRHGERETLLRLDEIQAKIKEVSLRKRRE